MNGYTKETRFPYWLVERWFCWFCYGMARYDDGTGVGPLAPRYEAFVDAVRCATAARRRS